MSLSKTDVKLFPRTMLDEAVDAYDKAISLPDPLLLMSAIVADQCNPESCPRPQGPPEVKGPPEPRPPISGFGHAVTQKILNTDAYIPSQEPDDVIESQLKRPRVVFDRFQDGDLKHEWDPGCWM